MTAITHVYNYTVRCPQQHNDAQHPTTWRHHIEINQSCEIALDRISKWHKHSGVLAFEVETFVVRKVDNDMIYFAVHSDRLKADAHALVTFKLDLTNNDEVAPTIIIQQLIEDYQQRVAKIG